MIGYMVTRPLTSTSLILLVRLLPAVGTAATTPTLHGNVAGVHGDMLALPKDSQPELKPRLSEIDAYSFAKNEDNLNCWK